VDSSGAEAHFLGAIKPKVPPVVVRSSPGMRATDSPSLLRIEVVFSEPVTEASVNEGTIILTLGEQPVPGQVVLSEDGLVAVFVTDESPLASTTYTLRVTRGVLDRSGDALAEEYRREFTLTPGVLQVIVGTIGQGTHPDGYSVHLDGSVRGAVGANDTLVLEGLPFGTHTVGLTDVSSFCTPAPAASQNVALGLEPVTARFEVSCEAAPPGRIAFIAVASAAAAPEIRTIRGDGTGERTVATEMESVFSLAWSPDGSQIAFIRWAVNSATLHRVNADGTGLTEVAALPLFADELDWGSGGTLVFSAEREGTSRDLWFIEADGSDLRPAFLSAASRHSPGWSPDGTRLAFHAVRADGDTTDLTLVNADGSSPELLISGSQASASWSPDGTTIAFVRVSSDGHAIWTIGIDGSGLRKLTDTDGPQFSPSWSPDGAWVAFTTENASGQPLLIARTDGSEVRQARGTFRYSGQPDWDTGPE
jgi:TolB protein